MKAMATKYQPGTGPIRCRITHCRNDSWTDVQTHSKQPTILQSV